VGFSLLPRLGRGFTYFSAPIALLCLLAAACGVDYEEARRDAVTLDFAGVPMPVASPPTLMRTKNTTRPSDAADRQFLQALIDETSL